MVRPVKLDIQVVQQFLKYARLLSQRGYVHNTLGNIVLRVPHPDFQHGVAYTKHAELSLEEMDERNIVITDIPTSKSLVGDRITSIGHNLSREILRLRPDINATIHVHDDAMIAFFGSGAFTEIRTISLDLPFVLGKPIHYVPAHVDVEADVSSVASFIQNTNSVMLLGHGMTLLGRTISEAYHRLNSLTAEIRRNITAEQLARLHGAKPHYRSNEEIESMYRFAEAIIYPKRAEHVMQEDHVQQASGARAT
ncbi:MAG: class II aldolase/adducin family protein [Betaproteobacteria bacterium]|nr:class II aldolase/adducin family protein [Betaproteobacteria bacterium]